MTDQDTKPIPFIKKDGVEVWSTFDRKDRVWDLWTSPACTTYIGGAERLDDVRSIALEWIAARQAEAV